MRALKAYSYSDYQFCLNEMQRIEREDLEQIEVAKGTSKNLVRSMQISVLRQKNPAYLIPPLKTYHSAEGKPRSSYYCPYCFEALSEENDSLICRNCPDTKVWSK